MKTNESEAQFLDAKPGAFVDSLAISIASPEAIRSWSGGEVTFFETIPNNELKPAKDGLFCEGIFGHLGHAGRFRLFGQVKDWEAGDWECSCGIYRGIEHRGIICSECKTEVTVPQVRREQFGHVELAAPVSHIWFLKNPPHPISVILGMSVPDLESVIYYYSYMVIDPGSTALKQNQLLTKAEYVAMRDTEGSEAFMAKTGAEAVRDALSRVDLEKKAIELEEAIAKTRSSAIREKLAPQVKLLRALRAHKVRPEWMILTVLPVLPPGLRPLVPLGGGAFRFFLTKEDRDRRYRRVSTLLNSGINELYSRVIRQNGRLKEVLGNTKAEESAIHVLKRLLQRTVDALFDNGHHGIAVPTKKQPLSPLSAMLRGKRGRFRQNLLGKRVDYSGRSVIVVGPELKLHQCGLPKRMALVLFEPFLIHRLMQLGYAHDIRSAKNWIERRFPEVWGILEGTMKGHPVLLNRAPTLHRLSIQAFEPVLIEGEAIRLHPLVCTAYNADFDGDQMAVHVLLSPRAQMEARQLMMAPNNIFNPSNGKPIMAATQDIALGCYYLTAEPRQLKDPTQRLVLFGSKNEALFAYSQGAVGVHDRVLLANPDLGHKTVYGDPAKRVIETTVGRIVFSEIWPEELGFYNAPAGKSEISSLIWRCYKECGQDRTVAALDKLKEIGFREATRAGISIGIDDMIIPKEKERAILAALGEIRKVEKYKLDGVITRAECEEKSQHIWRQCTDHISEAMIKTLEANAGKPALNPLLMMLNSGARGNKQQVRQIAGLRGLMAKPIRKPIKPTSEPNQEMRERPILSNFREGLGPVDWFISTHGARQGLSDTALKTEGCGLLTRKLVYVAHDVVVDQEDCGTANGLWVQAIREGQEEVVKLADRLVGRVACDTIFDPIDPQKVLLSANQEISEGSAQTLVKAGIEKVKIRSVLTCESKHGVCISCYGRNLATGALVKLGEPVGIIAGQSIGEPGTQLTMRTFHTGGVASEKGDITLGLPRVNELLEARHPKNASIMSHIEGIVEFRHSVLGKRCLVVRNRPAGIKEAHLAPISRPFLVSEGEHVGKGQPLTKGPVDPHDTLEMFGPRELQERLVTELQEIYRVQGVTIHEKHIEIIVRQMLRHVQVTDPGDTKFFSGEQVEKPQFEEENARVEKAGGQPAEARLLFLGITKASRQTDSFLSAASFGNTTQVLTEAAVMSKRDELFSLKANIITGQLIPAGIGFELRRKQRGQSPAKSASEVGPAAPAPPGP